MDTKDNEIRAAVKWGNSSFEEPFSYVTYPDGQPLVRPSERTHGINRLLVRPSSVLALMTSLWYVDALRERGLYAPELVLPLVPGSRQDRLNPTGDYLFTLKSVAREINIRRFPRVIILDPHSDVAPALIERCEVIHADEIIRAAGRLPGGIDMPSLGAYDAVVCPDAGAEKRAGHVAKLLSKPLLHGWKTRDVKDGKITGFGLEAVSLFNKPGHTPRVLVVDDLCDAGGTFIGLGQILKERGYIADLWVTHGYFSKGTAELTKIYSRIITTDSVVGSGRRDPRLSEVQVCGELLLRGKL